MLLLSALILSCGSGAASAPSLSTPTPSDQPSPTPTPEEAEPTPTAPPTISPDEVLLATGWIDDAVPAGTSPYLASNVVFRFAGGAWNRIDLPLTSHGTAYGLDGVTFADAETAYAWGSNHDTRSVLFRSDDRGVTWADVSEALPDVPIVTDLRFARSGTAWLTGGWLISGVGVWASVDGTGHWMQVPGDFGFMRSNQRFVIRGDRVELAYGPNTIRQLEPAVGDPQTIALSAAGFIRTASAAAGNRVWFVGFDTAGTSGSAIYSGDVGEPFAEAQVEASDEVLLQSIDVRGSVGIACGVRNRFPTPYCVHSDDVGATWRVSRVPELDGYGVTGVVLGSESVGWAVTAENGEPYGVKWLTTTDGGRSWTEAPRLFTAAGRITAIVHN